MLHTILQQPLQPPGSSYPGQQVPHSYSGQYKSWTRFH